MRGGLGDSRLLRRRKRVMKMSFGRGGAEAVVMVCFLETWLDWGVHH